MRMATPAKRDCMRARVLVRCACGHEQLAWCQEIEADRTTGCRSRVCKARFEAAEELRHAATEAPIDQHSREWLSGFLRRWVGESRVHMMAMEP